MLNKWDAPKSYLLKTLLKTPLNFPLIFVSPYIPSQIISHCTYALFISFNVFVVLVSYMLRDILIFIIYIVTYVQSRYILYVKVQCFFRM